MPSVYTIRTCITNTEKKWSSKAPRYTYAKILMLQNVQDYN